MPGHELARLRRELSRHEAARGIRYDPDLKRQAIAFSKGRRRAGASWTRIADELGLNFKTLLRWSEKERPLRAVEVIEEPTAATTVSVVSASGFRLEGLTLEQAVAALRALG